MSRINAKALFAAKLEEIQKVNPKLYAMLKNKELKVIDHQLWHTVKASGNSNIILFGAECKSTGAVSNVHQGRLAPNSVFLMTSIHLYSATSGAANSTITDAAALDFKTLSPKLRNARFTLDVGASRLITEASCEAFEQYNPERALSEYYLESPRYIFPEEEIKMEIQQIAAALEAETWLKVVVKGVMSYKN